MAFSQDYLDYVLEQFSQVPHILPRKMFGAVALQVRGFTFAILDDDVLYLKVDATNRGDYEAAGMEPFAPDASKPEFKMPYYEVPAEVLEDRVELAEWARRSMIVAENAKKSKGGASKKAAAKKAPVKKATAKKTAPKKSAAKKK